jgi:glutamate/aspartate transport system substrate-binding protein
MKTDKKSGATKVFDFDAASHCPSSACVRTAVNPKAVRSVFLAGLLAAAALISAAPAQAQAKTGEALTGTLAKVHQTGVITIGYLDWVSPFSFLNARKEPIGYSIELCRELVTAIEDAANRSLTIKWAPLASDARVDAIESGAVDLECGASTNNLERQKRVSFSPTIFVSGTKVLVKKGSPIRSVDDLAGKRVAVAVGTTNEKVLRELSQKFKAGIDLRVARDNAESFGLVKSGQADAFATDDVLLHGLIARNAAWATYEVVPDYLSYEPYGIMYRKGDAQLGKVINDTFQVLAEEGEIERQYKRWFLRRLPTGESLNLPMSARLEGIIQTMGGKVRKPAVSAGTSSAMPRSCRTWRARRSVVQPR